MKVTLIASCLILIGGGVSAQARGAVFPTYHPTPCQGGDCRGDDEKSGMPCQGFLCTFSSAKSLQKPMTASEAAEAQARAAATAAPPPPVPEASPEPVRKKRKAVAKSSKKSVASDLKRDETR